jgi:CRP-like cAMP-binding protein
MSTIRHYILCHSEPKLSELFMSYLLTRNSRIEEDLIDQLFNSSEKRLARLLLLLANFGRDGGLQPIKVRISQETLAEMIGTTRSRVKLLYEQISKAGFHQLQWRDRSAQFTVERGSARQAPDPDGLAAGADLKRSAGAM